MRNLLLVILVSGCVMFLICSVDVAADEKVDKKKKEGNKDPKPHLTGNKHEENVDEHHEEVTTHRPLLALPSFQIPLPQISFPQITLPQLHFPPLPQLPSFTHLPDFPAPFKKETITATRTVFIETTRKVTRHPICVTAYGPKPPCLDSHHHALRELENNLDEMYLEEKKSPIEPTKVVELPSVRSTVTLEGTESSPAEKDAAEQLSEEGRKRNARYLVAHPQFRKAVEEGHHHDLQHDSERVVEGLLKDTHYITKTLYVTKVEKTIDHQVTATLVAKNCIPSEPRLPHCGPLHPVHEGAHINWKETAETDE